MFHLAGKRVLGPLAMKWGCDRLLNLSGAIRLKYEPLNCHNEEGASICAGINSTTYSALNIAGNGLNAGRLFSSPSYPSHHQSSFVFSFFLWPKEALLKLYLQPSFIRDLVQICTLACQPHLSGHLHLILPRSHLALSVWAGKCFLL